MSAFVKTLIVAPSGGDFATIRQAVTYFVAYSIGGVVIVEEGTYDFDNTGNKITVDIPSNVTIIGRGAVKLNVTANIPVFRNNDSSNGNERIVISGFKIEINYSGGAYTINVIEMTRVCNSVMENLTISCISNGGVTDGSAIKFEGGSNNKCKGNIVSQCKIMDFGYSSNYGRGIYFKNYCEKNMIHNNYLKKCYYNIHLESAAAANTVVRNCISDNIVTEATHSGIYVQKSNETSVVGNECSDNDLQGILIGESMRCTVQGNVCKGNESEGIRVLGSNDQNYYAQYIAPVNNYLNSIGQKMPKHVRYDGFNSDVYSPEQ